MSWSASTKALLFKGICEFPPIENKDENVQRIRDMLNSSTKKFQKKFSLSDVLKEINTWYDLSAEHSQDNQPSSSSADLDDAKVKDESKETSGRAARATKRRRYSNFAADAELENEADALEELERSRIEEARMMDSSSREESPNPRTPETGPEGDALRSRRVSRAARPSMTRSSLSPQRKPRQVAAKVKEEEEEAEDGSPTAQQPKTKARAATGPPLAKRRKVTKSGSYRDSSDSESDSETARKPKKQTRPKLDVAAGGSAAKVKKSAAKQRAEERAHVVETKVDSPRKSRLRRGASSPQPEPVKKAAAPASGRGRAGVRKKQ